MLKTFLFLTVLSLASAVDIKHKIVPTMVHIAMFTVGLMGVSISSWIGLALTFLPLFFTALSSNGNIGGGDVKLAGMIGFCMGCLNGLCAVLIGLILGITIVPIKNKLIKKQPAPFALVPYLSAGCFIFIILNGGI